MRIWRWCLALLLVLYGAQNGFFAAYITSLKFGWLKAAGEMRRLVPLSNDTTILQAAVGWIAVVLFFVTAWRLVRYRPAFGVYAIAFALSVANWLSFKLGSVYDQVFTPAEQKFDYVLIAIMATFGLAIWLTERGEEMTATA
jgi:hypothetical protein